MFNYGSLQATSILSRLKPELLLLVEILLSSHPHYSKKLKILNEWKKS